MPKVTVATSTFSGPVPVTAETGKPFGGVGSPVGLIEPEVSDLLKAHDYVEEEYFVSGTVNEGPYVTTLLVRKPKDTVRFSGLVALEPVHVQGALGLWQTSHATILKDGHVWVAVGSQRGAVEGPLKMSNPARYRSLQVPETTATPALDTALLKWSQSSDASVPPELFAVDRISNQIMTQVGAALKGNVGPLAGVKYLLMAGASQTGMHTLNYIRDAHAAARLPDGKPVYDGYLPMAAPAPVPVAGGDAAVLHIFAEGDLPLFGLIGPNGYVGTRPDGDAPNDRYRSHQIAASSHLPTRGLKDVAGLPALGVVLEPGERFTQFPSGPFYHGAFANLVNWVTKGVLPPNAPPIEIAKGEIVRDAFGNAKGGLRSPYVDVPTVRYLAARYVRNLVGVEIPFPPDKLQSLYKSRAEYLQRFNHGIDGSIAGRWILAADGQRLKREEAENPPL